MIYQSVSFIFTIFRQIHRWIWHCRRHIIRHRRGQQSDWCCTVCVFVCVQFKQQWRKNAKYPASTAEIASIWHWLRNLSQESKPSSMAKCVTTSNHCVGLIIPPKPRNIQALGQGLMVHYTYSVYCVYDITCIYIYI